MVFKRIDPSSKSSKSSKSPTRRDPKTPSSNFGDFFTVLNKDPLKRYVLVNKGDVISMGQYQMQGWLPVERTAGGVALAGANQREGELIEFMGMILHEISLERWEEIQQVGPYGHLGHVTGQQSLDELEERMLDRENSLRDPVRGIQGNGQYFRVEADYDGGRHMHLTGTE